MTEFRAQLSQWLALVRDGQEVVVTERGLPVARLISVDVSTTLELLTETGQIARPRRADRPVAVGRKRPRPTSSVAEIISEGRR